MSNVVYGKGHLTSIQGLLKIIELVLLLITSLCVSYEGWGYNDDLKALMSAVIIGIFVSVLLLVICSSESGSNHERILSFQCFFHFCWFIFLIVTSAYYLGDNADKNILTYDYLTKSKKAGCAFGILASITYLADAAHSFIAYRPF